MHFTVLSADRKRSVLVTIVVPSPWLYADNTGGPRVTALLLMSHRMVDGGLDLAVQFASVTPEGDVEKLTWGLGKTGDRNGRSGQLVDFYSFVTKFLFGQ